MDILSYKLGKNASGGGGGTGDIDWSAIGYTGTPQSIIDGYNYAKGIQQNWTQKDNLFRQYYQDYKLLFFPSVNTSNTTNFASMFENSSLVETALFDTSKGDSFGSMFSECKSLKKVPQFDLSNATGCAYMFSNCKGLEEVPIFNLPKATSLSGMFLTCNNLSDKSLNNIMASCITATSLSSSNKKLSYIGINSTQATRCQSLSNYQAFLNAGWTTGY